VFFTVAVALLPRAFLRNYYQHIRIFLKNHDFWKSVAAKSKCSIAKWHTAGFQQECEEEGAKRLT
jgi:hypothetical protein